jgi:glycosyltransferase involved in cell wall biosynthesis
MSKYSIILPVRNGGDYVKECVNGILAQTLPDFNLLVLDNCSTDGTVAWIESLQDSRIQIFPADKPLSIVENWRRIVEVPKNEFITLIGHDDTLTPDYLAVMDTLIQKHPQASLYQAHFRYIDKDGAFKRSCLPMEEVQYVHEFIACQLMHIMDSMGTGYMMRSRDYDAVGGIADYPNLIFGDYEMFVQLIAKSYKATALAECFSYREHVSTSTATNGEVYQQAFGRYITFLTGLRQTDDNIKQVIDRYGKRYLLYFCESLSHRLLKTPVDKRSTSVAAFIAQCEGYARQLIPGQDFNPMAVRRIKLAQQLDSTSLGRALFRLAKKAMTLTSKPVS